MRIDEVIQQPGQVETLQRDAIFESLHVAVPGVVKSYNTSARTVTVQPAVRDWRRTDAPPLLVDVPVYYPGGYTFAVHPGDECLVVFADTCIDGWFEHGGVSVPVSARRHSLSDGFAFVGFRSRTNTTPGKDLDAILADIEERLERLEGSEQG